MKRKTMFVLSKKISIFTLLIMFLVSACGQTVTSTKDSTQPVTSVESTQAPFETSAVTPVQSPEVTSSPHKSPTATLSSVIFTAVKGALNIRRGPHISYNTVAVLEPNQSAVVHGRDLLGEWAMIDIPSQPGKTGWVSLKTEYSQINGDIFTLPEVWVDFAVPAYIRNCTFHNMTVEPRGEQLFNFATYPNNQLKIAPGSYKIYDDDSAEYSEVLDVFIREGNVIDITIDGDQNKHKCN